MGRIPVGAFYNPHLARETLALAGFVEHLAMADPPRGDDPHFPAVRERFTLLLHDYLGQLSEPVDGAALARARALLARYRSPWAAEHLQRVHTSDGARYLDYVFAPLYTPDLLRDYATHARALRVALGVPLAIEPIPTYLHVPCPGALDEPEFVARFLEDSGCHLLLDVAHAYLSARAAGRPAREFLLALPLERVLELHVAGTARDPALQDEWIGAAVPSAELLRLADLAAARAPHLRAITFDAFSTALTAETLVAGVRAIRDGLGLPPP